MRNPLVLVALGLLLSAAQSLLPSDIAAHGIAATELAFGFLLLAAFFAGDMLARLGLPRLVGYILAGITSGPDVLGLISEQMTSELDLVSRVAVCLIALTAGGELNLKRMRPLLRVIFSLTVWAVIGTALVLSVAIFLMAPILPFLSELEGLTLASVCLMLGIALAAQSPAVVMALISETRSDGPVSRTILGTVVVGDIVIIMMFGLASSFARAMTGASMSAGETVTGIAWELLGSIGAGVLVGFMLAIYLRNVRQGIALFVSLLCIVVAEIGVRIHLDPLILMLSAGLVIANFSEAESKPLIDGLEGASLPVYLVFFAVAGASIHLDLLAQVGLAAASLVAVRAASFWVGGRFATRGVNVPPDVRRWAWSGLLPQAGLALALALLLKRAFGDLGDAASALLFGTIAMNELLMPVVLRHALVRSGEAGTPEASERFSYPAPPMVDPRDTLPRA